MLKRWLASSVALLGVDIVLLAVCVWPSGILPGFAIPRTGAVSTVTPQAAMVSAGALPALPGAVPTLPPAITVLLSPLRSPLTQLDAQGFILFQSFRNDEDAVYVMRDDGAGTVRLLGGADPAWSPDTRHLAFSQVTEKRDRLYLVEIGKAGQTRLTTGFTPAWSPDGGRLAFADVRQGQADIFVLTLNGMTEYQVTRQPADELDPTWAPNGQLIAFGREGQIVVVNLDGTERAILSDKNAWDSTPAWSPDGTRVVYSSRTRDTDGNGRIDASDDSQIMVVTVDGQSRVPLTAFPYVPGKPTWAQHPAWSPDGSRLAFESNRDGQWDIFVMNADGSGVKNLTAEVKGSFNLSPCWRPTPR
jgi:Tol biopolymer transport system component